MKSSFTVKAKAQDNGGKEATYAVQVFNKAKKVDLSAKDVTLSTVAVGKLSKSGSVTAKPDNGTAVTWSSPQNGKIINISQSGNTVNFSAIKSGSATITATATDGSNKKASVKVKVIVPVSGVSVIPSNIKQYVNVLATGGSLTYKTTIGEAYGKPTNRKIKWTYTVYVNGSAVSEKEAKKYATISQGGRITAKGSALNNASSVKIRATVSSTDGSNFNLTVPEINVFPRIKNFGFPENSRYVIHYGEARIGQTKQVDYYIGSGKTLVSPYKYEVTVDNPKILSATCEARPANQGGGYRLHLTGIKKGETKITAKLLDGSNIKSSFLIKVY